MRERRRGRGEGEGETRGALNCLDPFERETAINDPFITFGARDIADICIEEQTISGLNRTWFYTSLSGDSVRT